MVERKDSHHAVTFAELDHYAKQMIQLFGSTKLPAVVYKGRTIPQRTLSDFSYLTSEPQTI